jgi:class 3 adenylate cyclase
MPLPKIIPALADLTQDIAGPVPVELLRNWATGKQDLTAAETLLEPFQIKGTVVSSDTSGLTRLTQEEDLLDVLCLVSQPKEILYALGREIGGRAIGTWVADNTEMFYPAEIDLQTVIDAMGEVQFRIRERLRLRIGMCIHPGAFYEIGGGLYGNDADEVEYLAELCAGPDVILLTESGFNLLRAAVSRDLNLEKVSFGDSQKHAYVVQTDRRLPGLVEKDKAYPHPFPEAFYRLLPKCADPQTGGELKRKIYEDWLRERTVVFIAREHQFRESPSLAGLLDDLVVNALMDTVIRETAISANCISSFGGGIAILTFPTAQEAVDVARAIHAKLKENSLPVQVGIDAGPILLFQNSIGPSGVSGDPINVASKLAEDVGRPGTISITDRAARHVENLTDYEPFEIEVSRITLRGVILA